MSRTYVGCLLLSSVVLQIKRVFVYMLWVPLNFVFIHPLLTATSGQTSSMFLLSSLLKNLFDSIDVLRDFHV